MVLMALCKKSLSPQSPLSSIPPKEAILHRLAAFDSTASALYLKDWIIYSEDGALGGVAALKKCLIIV
jgi:hypothetical protein